VRRVVLEYVNQCVCAFGVIGDCCEYLNKVNCVHYLIVYSLTYGNDEIIIHMELNYVILFHLIMNC
jgi:hypothetical protein